MPGYWKVIGRTAAALLGSVVVGCGGGGQSTADLAAAPVLRVEGTVAQGGEAAPVAAAVKAREATASPEPVRITLGALQSLKEAAVQAGTGPKLVGEARAVSAAATPDQTQRLLRWEGTATGGRVAALSVSAENALGLRLGVQVNALPEQAVLRVYSQARPATVYQILGKDVLRHVLRNTQAEGSTSDARTWWTPEMRSDEVTLEIELPMGVPAQAVDIALPSVSHIFAELEPSAEPTVEAKINESGSCNLDAVCDAGLATQSNAVARMLFTVGGKTYRCTGTLLNDARGSGTPYFLSANHCISSQAAASSMQTDWFYQSSGCNARALSSRATTLYNGAVLLYASGSTDVSFMRLNDAAPAGAFFAGWDASATAQPGQAPVVGLHHPAGDMLKTSKGLVVGQTSCFSTTGSQFGCIGDTGNFYRVAWSAGTTQGGSSGSALFTSDGRYVVGTLFGGAASCSSTSSPDYYGRFDVSYNQALKNWLGVQSSGESSSAALITPFEEILRVLRTL